MSVQIIEGSLVCTEQRRILEWQTMVHLHAVASSHPYKEKIFWTRRCWHEEVSQDGNWVARLTYPHSCRLRHQKIIDNSDELSRAQCGGSANTSSSTSEWLGWMTSNHAALHALLASMLKVMLGFILDFPHAIIHADMYYSSLEYSMNARSSLKWYWITIWIYAKHCHNNC